jgi:hypothetical protein
MIFKILFFMTISWLLMRLVQRQRLGLDLASLTIILILGVLALSFSPYWVEKIAAFLEFGTPSMVIVALVVAGLVTISLILSVMVSDLKRRHANMTRQLARLELRVNTPKLR